MCGRETHAVGKQPCPYEGCRHLTVWYWGWYERKEGKIPCEGAEGVSGPIPIRRFYCPKCGRTYSWRPRFLVFGRPLAAVAYEQALEPWALGRPVEAGRDACSWYQLVDAARKALRRLIRNNVDELLKRFRDELELSGSDVPSEESSDFPRAGSTPKEERKTLWHLACKVARIFSKREEQPRLTCHYLLIALARHSSGVRYSLEYA